MYSKLETGFSIFNKILKPTRKTDLKPETIIFHKTRYRPDP